MKRLTRLMPLVAVAAFVAVLLVPAHAFATKSIGISAPKFEFNMSAGQSEKGEIGLTNEGTEKTQVLIYATDQSVDTSGVPHFTPPSTQNGTIGKGPASWLQLTLPEGAKTVGNLPYVELAPGQSVNIKFALAVPADSTPGDHPIVIFFEMFDASSGKQGAATTVSGRIGSRIGIRVAGQFVEKLDVAPFAIKNFVIGDKVPWSFTITNSGNLDEHATVDIVALDSNETEVARSRVMTDTAVYAKTSAKHSGVLQSGDLGFGNYTVRLTADYTKSGASSPETITKDRTVFVVPLWVVYAAIAIVALLLIGLIVLVSRRARRKAAAAAATIAPAAPVVAAEAVVEEQRKAE